MATHPAPHADYSEFRESLAKFPEYPRNLVRVADFPYTLDLYRTKLDEDEIKLFSQRSHIIIRDLVGPRDANHVETRFKDTNVGEMRNALTQTLSDPCRRFIFLQSASSRGPLLSTREQLLLLLSRHQVMPSFIEFIFTFKSREKPHSLTSFRYENYLSRHHEQVGLKEMGRSGITIQHCFNILGMEEDKKTQGRWLQRQIAAYHSFDILERRALWVIIKGDATMRKRVESATEDARSRRHAPYDTLPGAFKQTLDDHILLLQWCVENWGPYTESFENQYRYFSSITEHSPVKEMVQDIAAIRIRDEMVSKPFSRQHTGQTQNTAPPQGILRRFSSKLSNFGVQTRSTGFDNEGLKLPPTQKIQNLKLDDLISFDKLQELNRLDKSLHEAIAVIDQNKRVLTELRKHYQDLVKSRAFKLHLKDPDLESCQEYTSEFIQKIGRLESDLINHQGNLRSLLRGLERIGVLFNGILQYQNMRTAEYFSKSAQDSARLMQLWTEKMHKKTVSMHVITLFTLIFLPGTFVATIFSSGILTFGDDGSEGFGARMGDWKVRLAGLKLFFAICVPLMTLTLCAWFLAYYLSKRKQNSSQASGEEDDGPILGEKRPDMV